MTTRKYFCVLKSWPNECFKKHFKGGGKKEEIKKVH